MNWNYLHTFVLTLAGLVAFLAAVIITAAWAVARFSRRGIAQKLEKHLRKTGDNLLAIPIEEARRLAFDRLAMSPDFETVKADASFSEQRIGSELATLLERFEEIHYLPDNSFLARAAIVPHPEDSDWLRIGKDGEFDWLLVRCRSNEVAVWDASNEDEQGIAERYPSIYHWLISLMP